MPASISAPREPGSSCGRAARSGRRDLCGPLWDALVVLDIDRQHSHEHPLISTFAAITAASCSGLSTVATALQSSSGTCPKPIPVIASVTPARLAPALNNRGTHARRPADTADPLFAGVAGLLGVHIDARKPDSSRPTPTAQSSAQPQPQPAAGRCRE